MLTSAQIRAARALLDWSQSDLARQANLGIATVRRLEADHGALSAHHATVLAIETAFQAEGIEFVLDGEVFGIVKRRSQKPDV